MLAEMRIRGLGVIDDATLELDPGLTVLTGETGAGKTMVVTGLTLLVGGRAEASRVADGARRAVVEGRFTRGRRRARGRRRGRRRARRRRRLIAVRTVGAEGRSRAYLGGRACRSACCRAGRGALAVHGQNDQLRLCARRSSGRCSTGTPATPSARCCDRYRAVRAQWQALAAELASGATARARLAQEADLLRHGLDEIEAVDPSRARTAS